MATKNSSCKAKALAALRPANPTSTIDEAAARRVLSVVDFGLVRGVGTPRPGRMCVEAAVSYAMGYSHGDDPVCVLDAVRNYKINLNDQWGWKSNTSRANGMRAVAIAQLGSNKLGATAFCEEVLRALLRRVYAAAAVAVRQVEVIALEELATTLLRLVRQSFGNGGATFADMRNALVASPVAAKALGLRLKSSPLLRRARLTEAGLVLLADIAVEALVRLKCKGTKYLYLLEKGKSKAKRRPVKRK